MIRIFPNSEKTMRLCLPIAASLALGLAGPAYGDVTARYAGNGAQSPSAVIAVDESGQVRAEVGPAGSDDQGAVLITRGGVAYLVASDASGRFVGRQDDILAVFSQVMDGAIDAQGRTAIRGLAEARFEVREGGSETVGGRQGRVYTIAPAAGAEGGPSVDIVVSVDPDLEPVGREMNRLLGSASGAVSPVIGATPDMVVKIREVLARGTAIRVGDFLRLQSVSAEPIPDSAFDLPGPVLTRAQLAARAPRQAGEQMD
jgi:hypothetical protein